MTGVQTCALPICNVLWDCLCKCGNVVPIKRRLLTTGIKKTCGCARIKTVSKNGEWIKSNQGWGSPASRIKSKSLKNNVPFGFKSISEFIIYLDEIAPKTCPIFKKPLAWGKDRHHDFSPSVDKIIPEKGYVKGNIQVISYLANRMKNNASPKQLKQFASWVLAN